ncbi:MAG: desulfoferrodoxin family protein [Clostridia bacterium]|nr:desulfoferrodoxin family protein [Clostridia bacterium]MDD4798125.1 desulfoferrodoxin family protein [Clostridia bacterium]
MDQKFFICEHCGNLVGMIEDSGVPLVCCGEDMKELVANTVEASQEKHLPVVNPINGGIEVTVGSVAHPMETGHHIAWVYVKTNQGGQRKALKEEPKASFALTKDEKAEEVYAYCNLHGLWKTELLK